MAEEEVAFRPVEVMPQSGDIEVETLFTGISRGTERLVFEGRVPVSEHETMRAPFQEGEFSYPIKYGYSAVGKVVSGARVGEVVFALHPHQTRFALPASMALTVPDGCPPERAILAANMETALNIIWDANITAGDRVAVVGCGVVGALVGYLSAQIPGTEVTMVDVDQSRAKLARGLGCDFAQAAECRDDMDVVVHASATAAGLQSALDVAGLEAVVVEASWYGDRKVQTSLGAAFHRKRLRLVSSQVGRIPANQSARWSHARRLKKALDLLCDPSLDMLISGETRFAELTMSYAEVLADPATLCHRIRYGDEPPTQLDTFLSCRPTAVVPIPK